MGRNGQYIGIGAIGVGIILIIGVMRGTWQNILNDAFGGSSGTKATTTANGATVTPAGTQLFIEPQQASEPAGVTYLLPSTSTVYAGLG